MTLCLRESLLTNTKCHQLHFLHLHPRSSEPFLFVTADILPTPKMADPIPRNSTTCLLLIDNQLAFLHPTHWGTTRSNPSFEVNISSLLSAFRHPISSTISLSHSRIKPRIIHVQHFSKDPTSPLHPSYIGDARSDFDGKHGVDFLPFMQPGAGERIVTKGVNSAFIGTELEKILRDGEVRTLVIAGLTTDHCVSTTTRMAANLGVCEGFGRDVSDFLIAPCVYLVSVHPLKTSSCYSCISFFPQVSLPLRISNSTTAILLTTDNLDLEAGPHNLSHRRNRHLRGK